METYFILIENIANYLFSSLSFSVWRVCVCVCVGGGGVFNLQYNNEDAKGLISDHNSKDTHKALTKMAKKDKTTTDVTSQN